MTIIVSKDKEWNVQTVDTTFCEVSILADQFSATHLILLLKDRDGDRELTKSGAPDKTDAELCCKLNF